MAAVAFALLAEGCRSILPASHYDYAVIVVNEGNEQIKVQDFLLFDNYVHNKVDVGLVAPNGIEGRAPYRFAPKESVTIKWKSTVTKNTGKTTVTTKMPKEFTMKFGSELWFYINPEKESVRVAYRVLGGELDPHFVK